MRSHTFTHGGRGGGGSGLCATHHNKNTPVVVVYVFKGFTTAFITRILRNSPLGYSTPLRGKILAIYSSQGLPSNAPPPLSDTLSADIASAVLAKCHGECLVHSHHFYSNSRFSKYRIGVVKVGLNLRTLVCRRRHM